jgi:hypothetical protein
MGSNAKPTREKRGAEASSIPTGTISLPGHLAEVREQALHCRNCDLWRYATQTVFGLKDLESLWPQQH